MALSFTIWISKTSENLKAYFCKKRRTRHSHRWQGNFDKSLCVNTLWSLLGIHLLVCSPLGGRRGHLWHCLSQGRKRITQLFHNRLAATTQTWALLYTSYVTWTKPYPLRYSVLWSVKWAQNTFFTPIFNNRLKGERRMSN